MRTPAVCSVLGLCGSQGNAGTKEPLAEAKHAAEKLERSADIDSYRDAAGVLKQDLLTIRSDQLSTDQKAELERLELMYQRASVGLKEEKAAETLLEQASLGVKNAEKLTGGEQQQEIEKALDALSSIPGGSFAVQKARELKKELITLVTKEASDQGATPKSAVIPREQETARPKPRRPQGESAEQGSGGWRKPSLWESGASPPRTPNSTGDLRDQPLF